MNTNRQRQVRWLLILVGSIFVFQACEPVRTVKSTRPAGGYKFAGHNDNELESNKKGNKSLGRFEAKNRGEKIVLNSKGEKVRTEKQGDLFSDREGLAVRESGTSFRGQDAKFRTSRDYKSKSFKTPEYLKRDEFASQSYREGGRQVRESDKSVERQLFNTKAARDTDKAARVSDKSYRSVDNYSTSNNRAGTKAQENAAIPTGKKQQKGYKQSPLTVDDVRKLVHPETIQ